MNANLPFDTVPLWHLAGWTMVHFLWLGTLIAAVAFIVRVLSRRATPNVRYATALTRAASFPSLEEQKLPDLAWKRLGLDLAPIGEEELTLAKTPQAGWVRAEPVLTEDERNELGKKLEGTNIAESMEQEKKQLLSPTGPHMQGGGGFF
jgi:hypothetical protein